MARKQTLKVYRTPIGFHDAYVAAPSQKAALEAWGSDNDLFARGMAERVEDPALTEAPLAQPGIVIRRSRGTAAEQIAALPADKPRAEAKGDAEAAPSPSKPLPKPKPKPRPSRADLDAAERALSEAEGRAGEILDEIARRERELARERAQAERNATRESDRLQERIDSEREAYEAAMREWRG